MREVIANCLDFCEMYDRLPYFYITGGDPILHPDFWRLLGLQKEDNIPFTIMGNPFHLTDEVCRRLKSHGCQKYQLSLDGMPKTHDWFRSRMPASAAAPVRKTAPSGALSRGLPIKSGRSIACIAETAMRLSRPGRRKARLV